MGAWVDPAGEFDDLRGAGRGEWLGRLEEEHDFRASVVPLARVVRTPAEALAAAAALVGPHGIAALVGPRDVAVFDEEGPATRP